MRARLVSAALGLIGSAVIASAASAAPVVNGEFALPAGETPPLADNEIVEGPDGNMWVTTETNSVVRIRPNGSMTAFPLAADAFGITVGPDNNLWASQAIGVVKDRSPATGTATPRPRSGAGYANGRGITIGPDNKHLDHWNKHPDQDQIRPIPRSAQDVNPITTDKSERDDHRHRRPVVVR